MITNIDELLPPLSIKNLSKSFKNKNILKDINLTIASQEIFGLIGLNGEGKTSMIKLILDLIFTKNSNIEIFGQPHNIHSIRQYVAYLPEKFSPSPYLKGEEFLQIYLQAAGKKYIYAEACDMAENLDLEPSALKLKISKYSKGMGQKLGLIAIFLRASKLLILDEPMSGLDPRARVCLKNMMRDYASRGNTIFFSSHILADIEEIATQIAILHKTKILYVGRPEDFATADNLENSFIKALG